MMAGNRNHMHVKKCNASEDYEKEFRRILAEVFAITGIKDRVGLFLRNHAAINCVGTLLIVGAILTILLNGTIFKYYWKKRKDITPFLYCCLSSFDFLNGASAFCSAMVMLVVTHQHEAISEEGRRDLIFVLKANYISFSVVSRTSVLVSTIVATIRTIYITRPTYNINTLMAKIVVALVSLWWLGVSLLDVLMLSKFIPDSLSGRLKYLVHIDGLYIYPTTGYIGITVITVLSCEIEWLSRILIMGLTKGIPFFLLVIMNIILMVIQIVYLTSKTSIQPQNTKSKRITVTILILTAVFTICNVPDFALCISVLSYENDIYTEYVWIFFVFAVVLSYLNSLLNPLILICRGSSLRKYLQTMLKCNIP